jgi:hypothetical protein
MTADELENIKPWEKPGKRLLNALWRTTHAWIFHEPVDPVKLNIDDYFDIIKKPMDFGTIKKKLNNNAYCSGEEFVEDLESVFTNCQTYNKPGTDAYIMCSSVFDSYRKYLGEMGLECYSNAVKAPTDDEA